MTGTSRLAIILNPAAGTSPQNKPEEIKRKLGDPADALLFCANGAANPTELARRALREGCDTVIAGGGDGTISSVAGVLAGTNVVLGVLPLGTLNHFAKDLGIPADLDEALSIVLNAKTAQVDVGEVNGRVFINNSSLGLYPGIVKEREETQKRGVPKWPAFAWAAAKTFARYPSVDASIEVAGRTIQRRTPFLFIGNNPYDIEGSRIGSRPRLDTGALALYTAYRKGRLGLFMLAVRALLGSLGEAKDFEVLTAADILIQSRRRSIQVAIDGELALMETPLKYRVRPGALRVIVP